MALKDLDQLTAEIDAAVHANGPLGKTTAPGLNALLKSLATELTARPEAGALDVAATLTGAAPGALPSVAATLAGLRDEQYQQPFVFVVENKSGDASACVSLSLAQARALITGAVASVTLTATAPTGDGYSLTATYDAASATFALSGATAGGDVLTARLVGGGAAPAPVAATFAALQGQPADNAALAAALAAKATTAPAPALEFVFEAGFADTIGRALGPRQAATYTGEQRQNVAGVSYQLNGVAQPAPQTQPLVLASGDVLQVAIVRQNTAQPAVLTLLS